jgi:DNA modification methylase
MRRPILNNSSPGQAVYEPFSGSGTTLIAAEMTGRTCHAIELDPAYVDVAIQRWQAFTGQEARLEGGASYAETRRARLEAADVGAV